MSWKSTVFQKTGFEIVKSFLCKIVQIYLIFHAFFKLLSSFIWWQRLCQGGTFLCNLLTLLIKNLKATSVTTHDIPSLENAVRYNPSQWNLYALMALPVALIWMRKGEISSTRGVVMANLFYWDCSYFCLRNFEWTLIGKWFINDH